ncbi:cilia- and flagella-associated protein 263-like isoform X2 [Tenebrio molitor]
MSTTSAASSNPSTDKVLLSPRDTVRSMSRQSSLYASGKFFETRSTRSRSSSGATSRKVNLSQRGSQFLKNPLDDMTNTQVVEAVQELQKNTKHLELENIVFLHFLEKNEPALIEGMESTLKNVQALQERASISSRRFTLTRHSRRESLFLAPSSSFMGPMVVEKEGPRINITQKTDLILREMDEIKANLEKLEKKCHRIRHKLKAELEEMGIRETEIQDTIDTFENVFVHGNVEKFTQANPADKFARFMEECFKQTRLTIDKIRLRTSSLKVQYQKICNQLTQKKLLGENLQEVDFEQLQIENKRLVEKIDQRNLLLLELKKMNGRANLLLSRHKKHLLKKLQDLKDIQDTIKFKEDSIIKLDDECDKIALELEETKAEYDKIKQKTENYEVPAVIEYVKKKAELGVLKKNLKVWARRKQIKDMALTASVREMKHTTGLIVPRPSWFVNPHEVHRGRASIESTFEFMFERETYRPKNPKRKKKNIRKL